MQPEQELSRLVVPDHNGIRNDDQSSTGETTPSHHVITVPDGETPPPRSPVVPASVPPEEGMAELEIQSLLWLDQRGNEVLKRAYEEWGKKDVLFASRIDKKKKQSNSLRNEIYQLIGFYSVFQGVLLTAASQSNLLHCNNWLYAFFLSLLASLVTIAGVLQKFHAIFALEKTILNESDTRQECINRASRIRQKRGSFNFNSDAKNGRRRNFHQKRLCGSIFVVAVILVAFSILFLISIYRVLCHPGSCDSARAPTAAAS